MSLHFQYRGGGLKYVCTFSREGINYVSALSVEGTKLCLCTFSRGGLNYVSALSVEGTKLCFCTFSRGD